MNIIIRENFDNEHIDITINDVKIYICEKVDYESLINENDFFKEFTNNFQKKEITLQLINKYKKKTNNDEIHLGYSKKIFYLAYKDKTLQLGTTIKWTTIKRFIDNYEFGFSEDCCICTEIAYKFSDCNNCLSRICYNCFEKFIKNEVDKYDENSTNITITTKCPVCRIETYQF